MNVQSVIRSTIGSTQLYFSRNF